MIPFRTIKAQGGQYTPFHWDSRPFTIEELKRLQTFPDDYQLVGNQSICIQQIGNSVAPQQARILALAILEQIFGIKFPFKIDYLLPNEELSFRKRKRLLTDRYAEIARTAINSISTKNTQISFESRDYYVRLETNFDFQETSSNKATHFIQVKIEGTTAYVVVKCVECETALSTEGNIEIQVSYASCKRWSIQQDVISIISPALEYSILVGWKVIEHELQRLHIKSDSCPTEQLLPVQFSSKHKSTSSRNS